MVAFVAEVSIVPDPVKLDVNKGAVVNDRPWRNGPRRSFFFINRLIDPSNPDLGRRLESGSGCTVANPGTRPSGTHIRFPANSSCW